MSAKLVIAIFLASLAVGCALAANCNVKYSLSEDKKSSRFDVEGKTVAVNQEGEREKRDYVKETFKTIFKYEDGFLSMMTQEDIFPRQKLIQDRMIYLENKDTGKFFLLNNRTEPAYLHTFVEGQVVTVVSNKCALAAYPVDKLEGELKDIVALLKSGDLMPPM